MRQSKQWYADLATPEYILNYYTGEYKRRNDVLISILSPLIPEDANILDIAAGSSYIAECLLDSDSISTYTWNDFNPVVIGVVENRITDDRFIIDGFDAEDPNINFSKFNVMICLSLEHIEKDIELINKMPTGSIIAICSPNFNAKSHVRYFNSCQKFENRYSEYIDIRASATLVKLKERLKNPPRVLKKFMICGIKKDTNI